MSSGQAAGLSPPTAPRHWFYLEDMLTGENRDVVTEAGGTEQDARNLLGDIWTDRTRVICHGPCPLEVAG